jgi:hypothetical protein
MKLSSKPRVTVIVMPSDTFKTIPSALTGTRRPLLTLAWTIQVRMSSTTSLLSRWFLVWTAMFQTSLLRVA